MKYVMAEGIIFGSRTSIQKHLQVLMCSACGATSTRDWNIDTCRVTAALGFRVLVNPQQ